MKFYIVSILAFLLTFCSDSKTSEKNNSLKSDSLFLSKIKSDTLSAGDTTMSELIKQFLTTNQSQTSFIDDKNETGNMYSNSIQAAIFSNLTIVYSEPDTTSTQVELLKFNNPIKILTSKHGLFEIEFQSKKGFVKTKAVSTHETSQSYSDGDDGAEWTSNVTLPLDPELSPIVYSEYQYGYIFDDSGNTIFNPDGSYKMKVQKNLRKYYKWDGLKLTLVSENNN